MANTSIRKTFSSNGNLTTWTLSFWVKRGFLGSQERMFSCDDSSSNEDDFFVFDSNDKINLGFYDYSYYAQKETNRKFRDTNAWYHIQITWDTTNSTAEDRLRLYVNGVRETSFSASTNPELNRASLLNRTQAWEMGKRGYNDTQYFTGAMSHVHFTDGYAYEPTAFGETDTTTGEWKIKVDPSVSYGTNGFWIFKDGATITDSSPNSNDWSSVSGTLTKTEDCPSNVFATFNPLLVPTNGTVLFTNGNNSIRTSNSQQQGACSTLGASSGKFYWECKQTANSAGTNGNILIAPYFPFEIATRSAYSASGFKGAISYGSHGGVYIGDAEWNTTTGSNSNASGSWSTYTVGDIVSVALDLDNNYVYFGKNGVWQNSGNPESGSNGTGGISLNVSSSYTKADGEFYFFGTADQGSSSYANYDANFGNGNFGTTAVASAGTNASGNGIFEYDVPTGYTALSTKGLNL
jgi:hypothetical protein